MIDTDAHKILVISDTHIGGRKSNFAAYREHIIERMTSGEYQHVVLLGDIWELFYVDRDHVNALSGALDVLHPYPEKENYWRKQFKTPETKRDGVENVIHGAELFVRQFLADYPSIYLHVVGGNHENINRFRNVFRKIQSDHPDHFEWSPEAIRIGDGLMTHGHLPLGGMTDEEYPRVRLRHVNDKQRWNPYATAEIKQFFGPVVGAFANMEHEWLKWRRTAEKTSDKTIYWMHRWEHGSKFHVSHNGVVAPLRMYWVKHIIFGHTHVKFDNYRIAGQGPTLHNSGAVVESTSQKSEDLGILEATLHADGTITDVQPVPIAKDKVASRVRGWRAPDSLAR